MWQVQVVILEDPDGHEICFVGKFTVPPTSVADQDPTRQWPGLINTILKNMKKKNIQKVLVSLIMNLRKYIGTY